MIVKIEIIRTLMQGCGISDFGAVELARVLSLKAEMNRDEIVEWRKARMELIVSSSSSLQLTIQPTKQKRPGSEHSSQGTGVYLIFIRTCFDFFAVRR